MDTAPKVTLKVLPNTYAVCRLSPSSPIPGWVSPNGFTSICRTDEELSIVCKDREIPEDLTCEHNWRIIKILGPLDFSLVGILSSISGILADAQVSIFAISTYDTDYILVKDDALDKAITALGYSNYLFTE